MKRISAPLHFAFCINDAYARYILVTIKSIIENHYNCSIHIHILTDNMSNSNREMLYEIIKDFSRVSLHIYEIDDTPLQGLETGHWSIYAWYRLLIPNTLSNEIKKVLYLDADTLVVSNLNMLFSIDMENKSIAAVEDIYSHNKEVYHRLKYDCSKKYICTGVMLMNLDFWRKNQLSEKIINWARHNSSSIVAPDQDAINYICRDTKIILPLQYGIIHWFFKNEEFYHNSYREQLKKSITNPAIIHYMSSVPWYKDAPKHIMHKEWLRYNRMLKHPVKRSYQAKGLLLVKIICWNILYPLKKREQLCLKEVKRRLDNV